MQIVLQLEELPEVVLENVPETTRVRDFIENMRTAAIFDEEAKLNDKSVTLALYRENKRLKPNELLEEGTYMLKKVKNSSGVFYINLLYLISIHVLAFNLILVMEYKRALLMYIGSWTLYSLISSIVMPPRLANYKLVGVRLRDNVVIEIIYWFFASLLPTFRLENVLIRE